MPGDDYVAMEGPVERRGEQLVLRVPLEEGGNRLKQIVHEAYEEDGHLLVVLPEWLLRKMRLHEGSAVHIDDRWGKLNLARLS